MMMLKLARRAIPLVALFVFSLLTVPATDARVNIGISIQLPVPAQIHVHDVDEYEPYYVGQVFYRPGGHWRDVYSFPVEVHGRIVFQPVVYDRGRLICRGHIPGWNAGYGDLVIAGRGHFEPNWYPRQRISRGYRHANWKHERYGRSHERARWDRNDRRDRSDGRSDSDSGSDRDGSDRRNARGRRNGHRR